MGLVYREYNTPESRQILTIRDLRLSLKQLVLKLAALYFITGYARDVIHGQVMWGATHQMTVEDYVMDTLNARFAISRNQAIRRVWVSCTARSTIAKNKSCTNQSCGRTHLLQCIARDTKQKRTGKDPKQCTLYTHWYQETMKTQRLFQNW
jgi:hypothetical protein